MVKKHTIAILIITVILTLSISFLIIYSKKDSEHKNYIFYQKLTSCRERLQTIGERIETYQNQNSGRNPPSLNVVNHLSQAELYKLANVYDANKYEGGECSYVYRGEDLDANAPASLILAYDRFWNHKDCRNVLFAKPQRIFYLGTNEVSKEEYDDYCKRILRTYDPNIIIHVKGWKDTPTNIVSTDRYTEEQYRTVCRAILNDYNSTDIQIIILEETTTNAGISKAFIEEKRVENVWEGDFLNIISFDNKIRQELGLPQKSL
ncbi:MAG: hypothetical protein ACYS67_12945 [Planctomycetota bacterium]|jgi:hypothetical protein